ncbi:MAG: peroxidase [Chloroflexi bacterium]|nr:peroxidase [Chloroflexota bacterium]MBI4504172.1 peroxidase [Chloroflexota bacterium]
MLAFTEKLTLEPGSMGEEDAQRLRAVGFGDEDLLEIAVVAAWYNFVSRIACALGVELDSEKQESPVLHGLPWAARPG